MANSASPPAIETLDAAQRARRERIVAAAVDAMLEQEYDKVQMKDVGATAGAALGTMYRSFNSKEHLFAEALLAWSERYAAETASPPDGPAVDRLKVAYRRAVRA